MERRTIYEGGVITFAGRRQATGSIYLLLMTPPLQRGDDNFSVFRHPPGHLSILSLMTPPYEYDPLFSDFVEFWDLHIFLGKAERQILGFPGAWRRGATHSQKPVADAASAADEDRET